VLFSEQFQLEMQRPPGNFSISPAGTAENPVQMLKEENVVLSLSHQGGALSSFVYSDGISDKTAKFENYNYGEKITPPVGVTTAYTIKSATNQCGTVPVNLTTYIKILPYRILICGCRLLHFWVLRKQPDEHSIRDSGRRRRKCYFLSSNCQRR
jgi:hypothetical protein